MLQIFLDDRPIDSPDASLDGAIRAASAIAGQSGRVIIEVRHDGRPVTIDALNGNRAPNLTGEVRLVSATLQELLGGSVEDAHLALDSAIEDQRRSASLIHEGQTAKALATVRSVIASWQTLGSLIEVAVTMIYRGTGQNPLPNLREYKESLTPALETLRQSVINEDWSALADVLEYDLTRQAEAWRGLLEQLGITRSRS